MRIRQKRWLLPAIMMVMAVVLMLVLLAQNHFSAREPTYGGKTFSVWFHESEIAPNFFLGAPSTEAIRSMGAAAVPFLAARLRPGPWWAGYYPRLYSKFPRIIRKALPEPRQPGVRQEIAARLLFEVGLPARAAASGLIASYDRAYLRHYQLPLRLPLDWNEQLTNPPTAVISGRTAILPEGNFRLWALLALSRCAPENNQVVPLLLASLHEPDANLRAVVINSLKDNTNLASAITLSEPVLLAALNDPGAEVRATAAHLLATLAPGHPEIIPGLIKAADDPAGSVSESALKALAKTKVALEPLVPMLARAFAHDDPEVRRAAMSLLVKTIGGAKSASSLQDLLGSTNVLVRAGAAQLLGNLGSRAKIAIPKLRELTEPANEPDEQVRHKAAEVLKKIASGESTPQVN